MIDQNINNGLSRKWNKLLSLATLSSVFAWFVPSVYLIKIITDLYEVFRVPVQEMRMLYGDLWLYILNIAVSELIEVVNGIIIYLILIGISLGLRMIVEMDINYWEFQKNSSTYWKDELLNDEDNKAVFYDPKSVNKLEKWLSKAAVISIYLCILINLLSVKHLNTIVISFFPGRPDLSGLGWIITILFSMFTIALETIIIYFPLKSLGTILLTTMELEFNSRSTRKI